MSGEKTEQPTGKKLRDARQKGQVAHSKDFTQTVLILALFGYLISMGNSLAQSIGELIVMPMDFIAQPFQEALGAVLRQATADGVTLLLPFLLIVLVVGIFGETMQVGILFAFEAIKPSAKKLNVLENAKNMLSKKNIIEFLKNSLKVIFLSALLYNVIRGEIPYLMTLPLAGVAGVGVAIGSMLKTIIVNIALAYTVLSLADFIWQRYSYKKGLMMSKDEIKQEYKQSEGDPHVKGARKHLHQEMMMEGAPQKARNASVVVTNPTHVAVALLYDEKTAPLPVVLTKGTGAVAARIVAIARENGVPVMQNIPLARALLAGAEIDHYVPSHLLEPVAEVLRLVRELGEGGMAGS